MNRIKVVSGYTPLSGVINVTPDRFRDLGRLLRQACATVPTKFFDDPDQSVSDTWMWQWEIHNYRLASLRASDPSPDPARFRVPQDKLLSNFIMHQKYEWLALAALEDPYPDVFVWIDYGVLKQEGMTQQIIHEFLVGLTEAPPIHHITGPGIRPTADMPDPKQSWDRFCGSLVIVPREWVFHLAHWAKRDAIQMACETGEVTIESNTLARAELLSGLPFHWYQSWWGASMFTSYPG